MSEQIARGAALRNRMLYAPLQHFAVDTVHGYGMDGEPLDIWHARCNCGHQTLGYLTPERATMALEQHHIRRMR